MIAKSLDGGCSLMVEVQVNMADGLDVFFGPSARVIGENIRRAINIGLLGVLEAEPCLELWRCDLLGGRQPLNHGAAPLIDYDDGEPILGLKVITHEFRGGVFLHGSSPCLSPVHKIMPESIQFGVESLDAYQFGNIAPSLSPFEVQEQVNGIADVPADGGVR